MARQELNRGDHIYVKTKIPGVSHHGIYCGNGYAIHFDGHTKTIKKSNLSDFTKPFDISCIKIVDYRDPLRFLAPLKIFNSFLKSRALKSDADTVIERAETLVGKSQYDLGRRNCEHFAVWCKTGRWVSSQIDNVMIKVFSRIILGGLAIATVPWPVNLFIGVILGGLAIVPLQAALRKSSKPPEA
ncbi:hypothetical protein ACX27_21960 [Nostoc piscinale CENA21]|uniref:LRAT domain-containing protein n=1 Tax=Nostoc piscinale CENA21 TaxID=224013 RepID=A0A0M4TMX4_9NOSO|nr:lecithin retinol acyltransferase family protein [Nostoc piscinale]ALF54886.1 hypothetical protein ACX27_21960 [Nostoc piscinale CENA21]